jgi:tetratricopeptide (TPR) repeat protein
MRPAVPALLSLTLLLAAPPARAGAWNDDYRVGQQAYKDGPFGGKVAGFFNALTGGAVAGSGTPSKDEKEKSSSGGSYPAAASADNLAPGKDSIFPTRSSVEEAQRKLSKNGVETAPDGSPAALGSSGSSGGPGGDSLSLITPEDRSAGATNPAGIEYGRPGGAAPKGRSNEAPVQNYYVPGLGNARPMSEDEIRRELARRGSGRPAAPTNAPQMPRGLVGDGPAFVDGRVAVPRMKRDADALAESRAEAHLRTARAKFRLNDWNGVLAEAELSLGVRPTAEAHTLKALSLNRLADSSPSAKRRALYERAEASAREATRLDPNDGAAWEELSWSRLRLKKYAEALESAERALQLNPSSAAAHYIRAAALEALGRREEGLRSLEEAARLDPAQYDGRLRSAKAGDRIFDPESDDSWQLLEAVSARRTRFPIEEAFLLFLVGLVGAGFWLLRRRLLNATTTISRRLSASVPTPRARPVAASAAEERLGGKYELLRVIGKGGMGQVWEARDHSLGRVVAIKRVYLDDAPPGSKGRELYIKEARTLASLHHPGIVAVFEILDLHEGLYFVFELLSGKTVAHLLAEQKRLPLPRVQEILRTVCETLEFAHGKGIVHRDLKPANIMVTDEGFVKVMDFGIARRIGDDASASRGAEGGTLPAGLPMARTQTVAGTPAYMPPEAEEGLVTPASDVYSLGVVLYEMLTGARPFGSHALAQKMERAYAKPSAVLRTLPKAVDELVDRALDPDLNKRLQSAKDFLRVLDALQPPPAA